MNKRNVIAVDIVGALSMLVVSAACGGHNEEGEELGTQVGLGETMTRFGRRSPGPFL